MNSFDSLVNQNLGWVHENKYVLPVLSLFLGMYAALARPKLPKFVEKLFENPVFRLVMISYIIYRGNQDPQLAVMIAAAFLITIHMINKGKVEKMVDAVPGNTGGAMPGSNSPATCAPPCLRNIERMTVPGGGAPGGGAPGGGAPPTPNPNPNQTSPTGGASPTGGTSGGLINSAGQASQPPGGR